VVPQTGPVKGAALNRRFTFDRVYDDKTNQETVFDTAVAPVVEEVLRGYSCTVFVYGQTGTGAFERTLLRKGLLRPEVGARTPSAAGRTL
jgi:kinesin family protein 11